MNYAGKMTIAEAKAHVLGALQLWKEDPGAIYEDPKVLYALSLCWTNDPQQRDRAKKAMKAAGIIRKDVEALFPRWELSPEDYEKRRNQDRPDQPTYRVKVAGEMLPDCPVPQMRVPHPFVLTAYAVERPGNDAEEPDRMKEVAPAPLLMAGVMEDISTGDIRIAMKFRHAKSPWKTVVVSREELLSIRGISKLAKRDFPVSDYNSKLLVEYIHKLDGANRGCLPRQSTTSHLGWQGSSYERGFVAGAYIKPNGEIISHTEVDHQQPETWSEDVISFRGVSGGDDQMAAGFYPSGSLSDWLELMGKIREHPKALIGLYVSFAPVLLEIMKCANFCVNWSDDSSVGKSTVTHISASVWGNPDERSGKSPVRTWKGSPIGLAQAAAISRFVPLFVDDTKQVRRPDIIPEMIYLVAGGQGATLGEMGGGQREVKTFRTILVTNGEQEINSIGVQRHGGAQMRVLEIGGKPFGARTAELEAFVKALNRDLCAHFGHAGPLFVRWLLLNREAWPAWRERFQALVTRYSGLPPIPGAGRIAEYAALIVIAGEMAHRALGLPWTFYDPMAHLWGELSEVAKDAGGSRGALRQIISLAHSRESAFIQHRPRTEQVGEQWSRPPANVSVLGRWDKPTDPEWQYLCFFEHQLRRELELLGYAPEAIIKSWHGQGWLHHRKGERMAEIKTGPSRQDKARMITITRRAMEEVDPSDPEPVAEDEEPWVDDE